MMYPQLKTGASAGPPRNAEGRASSLWRPFLLGAAVAASIAWLTPTIECFNWAVDIGFGAPSIAFIFFLFLAVLGNGLLRRFLPRHALTYRELTLFLSMVIVGPPLASMAFSQVLINNMVGPIHLASAENGWKTQFHRYLSRWMGPRDSKVIHDYYYGSADGSVPWGAWIAPLAAWFALAVAAGFVFYCAGILIRRQWVENERLSFPLLQIPLEMIRPPEPGRSLNTLFRNRLMWITALIPFICQVTKGLHSYYPSVPRLILLRYRLDALFPDAPWNGVGWWELSLYPFLVGVAYLLSAEIGFSCWFFYLMTKAQGVAGRAAGWSASQQGSLTERFPDINGQGAGAFIGLIAFTLWSARGHLKAVFRKAIHGDPAVDDGREAFSYRFAVCGIVAGSVFMLWWAYRAGASLAAALPFFAISLLWGLAGSRIRAEAGVFLWGVPESPGKLMVNAVGTQFIGDQNLTALAAMKWGSQEPTYGVLPGLSDTLKIPSATRAPARSVALFVAAGCLIYMSVGVWQTLRLYYHYGAHHAAADRWRVQSGIWSFQELSAWLSSPQRPEPAGFFYILLGAGFLSFLAWMRLHATWWPFHPVGYAISNTFTMQYTWFSFFLGWFLKMAAVRWGGLKLYRAILPVCFGLIIGDLVGNGLWAVLALFGVKGFAFNVGTW
ncbi:MAG: hypothetical protein IT210_11680 [Armatimonadetes bacterium]|nr:hypothetical protein [Armatimonadota bacterium]